MHTITRKYFQWLQYTEGLTYTPSFLRIVYVHCHLGKCMHGLISVYRIAYH